MVNCNPETVSTDYDTSDRLYFEPLTLEDVLEVVHAEQQAGPVAGVIVPARRADPARPGAGLKDAGVPIVGTCPEAIHLAEDRGAFGRGARRRRPARAQARHRDVVRRGQADRRRDRLPGAGPAVVRARRPRHGDRLRRRARCAAYIDRATEISPEHPVLVDRFLDDAIEIDVDALYDGDELFLGGVMEHIEEAGIHSGDSACALPPITLGRARTSTGSASRPRRSPTASACAACSTCSTRWPPTCSTCSRPTRARRAPCRSSPRRPASPLAKAAARVMLGATIAELRAEGLLPADGRRRRPARRRAGRGQGGGAAVQPVPHRRRPRRRHACSARRCGRPARSWASTPTSARRSPSRRPRPTAGCRPAGAVFVSVANRDKRHMIFPVKRLADLGFEILATEGTAEVLRRNGVAATVVRKHSDGRGPDGEPTIVERILAGEVDLVVNTPYGATSGGARARRLRDPHRGGRRRTSRASPRSRGWRRRCRASRRSARARSASGRSQELEPRTSRPRASERPWPTRPASASAERGPLQVTRRGALDPAGRRLPPPDAGRAGHRRARPGRATSSRSRSAATTSGDAAAPGVLDLPGQRRRASTAAPSRSSSPRTAPAPRGWPRRSRTTRRRRRPAGPPVRAAAGAGGAARWSAAATAARRCSRSPSSCASAGAGSTSCSARPPRPALRRARGQADRRQSVAVTTDDGSVGHQGPGHRRAAGADQPQPDRRRLRLRPDGRCCARSPTSPPSTARGASARSRSRWPAASASA